MDGERLDVILTLARDMGVNLAGIEIILNMREKLIEMERQMGEFAQVVQQELLRAPGIQRRAVSRARRPASGSERRGAGRSGRGRRVRRSGRRMPRCSRRRRAGCS